MQLDSLRTLLPDAEHWCQGRSVEILDDGSKAYCLSAAIANSVYTKAVWQQANALAEEKGYPTVGVVKFNDATGRTIEEIHQFIDELEERIQNV